MEIKWHDTDPETGERRYLRADRHARQWRFCFRRQRRDVRWEEMEPTREMWEYVLDSLQRRYRRREGVSDEDIEQVEQILKKWRGTGAEGE